jgi:TrfA protein
MSSGKSEDEAKLANLSPELQAAHRRLEASIQKREAEKVYQLEMWPDKDLGVPNELSRSALFAAIDPRKKREFLRNQFITAQGAYSIHFTGPQLDQSHSDVFQGILQLARGVHEGNEVHFTAHRLLKLIGRSTGGKDHKWLYMVFQDLTATSVAIADDGKRVFWDSLLRRGKGDLETGKYVIEISRDLAKLFERGFTRVEWEQRRKLIRKPLAQWLQFYYASHAKPLPVSVAFLHEMSGSTNKNMRDFKRKLKEALNQIQAVGVISEWHIDTETNLVHVTRVPSPSQLKYLTNRQE